MIRTSTVYSSSRFLCFNRTNPHRNSLHFQNPNFVTGNCFFSLMEGEGSKSQLPKSFLQSFYILCTWHHVRLRLLAAFLVLILAYIVLVRTSKAQYSFEICDKTIYWMGSGVNKSKAMVEQLQKYGVIRSHKVAYVMETIDRALFVPEGTPPYVDTPMPIGYNATISAPHMHAMCLELLEKNLQPGMHALDVGSGTGYLTACFAMMVGAKGRAVGLEHIPELVTASVNNIEKSAVAPLLKEGSLSVHVADGRLGWPEFAPYDAIHVGAAAAEIPKPLIDQLKPGGRMVIPVGNILQDLKVVDKNPDGSIRVHTETSVRYVPLTSRDAQLRGF